MPQRAAAWHAVAAVAAVATVATVAMAGCGLAGPGARGPGQRPGTASPSPRRSTPRRPPARPAVAAIGGYRVASLSIVVVDQSRPRLGARALPALVRYPVVPAAQVSSGTLARGPFPLVVFAPGYLQCRSSYAALLHAWASAGYVVAAVEFPRTHCRVVGPDEADLANQPADVSAVIGRLLRLSATPGGALSGLVDPAKIGVAGHSDGGDTAAALAASTCCRDRRVSAAIILSGAEWPPLGGRYFPPGAPAPPMLFTQGTSDTWNPPAASIQLYQADATGIRYYLDLLGADHFAPYEGHANPEPLVARVTVAFLNAYLDAQPAAVSALAAAGTVRGVAALYSAGRLPSG